jgi:DNA topoisomerase-1
VDVRFTRELEEKIQEIELGITGREDVVRETVEALKPAIEQLKINELEIGKTLGRSARLTLLSERTLTSPCPSCGSTLYIQKSRVTGKRFVTCSQTRKVECKFTLPLPQIGRLTLLNRCCPECGFQMVRTWSRGRRPLVTCSRCYAKKAQPGRKKVFMSLRASSGGTRPDSQFTGESKNTS